MAGKKDNIKALFSNTRTRIIILFTVILVIITVIIGFAKMHRTLSIEGESGVNKTPGIKSIPGALNQTAQYAALQEEQNKEQAEKAAASGTSSIPTIIRSQAFGEGVEAIGAVGGQGSVGFSTLARQDISGPQSSIWFQSLKDSDCSKESINQAVEQNSASMADLRLACTCEQLKKAGYSLVDLRQVCECGELKNLGYSIQQFKSAGYNAAELRQCGFVACEEHAAGFTAQEMKDAGYSDGELKGTGFTEADIARAGGLPDGVSAESVRKAGCTPENLKRLRASGVTAAAIKRISGCSAEQLKAAGFTARDLKNAGFSGAELKAAGFSPEQLKEAGYSARDLLNAGFSPDDLAGAGFSEADIAAAESILPPGISLDQVRKAGCTPEAIKRQRLAGVSAAAIKRLAHCNPDQLKAGGFTNNDLLRAGFTPQDLSDSKFDDAIRAAGCDPEKLKALQEKGVSAKKIHDLNGCSADVLKKAGYEADALLGAGFTPEQLTAAGISAENFDDEALKKYGCDPEKLKLLLAKGVSAERIHKVNGCNADALKKAGFGLKDLAAAGFSPAELLAAGFSPVDLANAGLGITPAGTIAAVKKDGCSVEALKAAKAAGVSAATIKQTMGCSAAALKAAGFNAAELKDAGFSAAELKDAGFNAGELKDAGFGAKDLRAAGFNASDLKAAGFDAAALKDAGFSASEMKDAGYSAAQLKAAGFGAKDLKNAGFTADELKKAGYPAKELKDAGYSTVQLKNAGFNADELSGAGVTQQESALAGLEKVAPLKNKSSNLTTIPSIGGVRTDQDKKTEENAKQLEKIIERQKLQQVDQRLQQKVQQRMSQMLGAANQMMQSWKTVASQQYLEGTKKEDKEAGKLAIGPDGKPLPGSATTAAGETAATPMGAPLVKMGDILFAVIDTSVNTDEPGPILATIVSGSLKGGKLIGSFNLPSNAEKMVISFNSLSLPGAPKTLSISAFAVDPNTARTALSSETNHHYLTRYGALFASTFLEGFGNAFQSANTTVTVGGTGGVTNTTIQNGIGRSALENAVIGLATVGKAWGQVAQQNMSRPTTVQVYSGTAVGVLFTQDLRT